jgi:hypothetical protein
MNSMKKLFTLFTVAALLMALSACDISSEIDDTFAAAFISAEFIDASTGDGIAETEVIVSAAFEGSSEIIDQGFIETDEFGRIETPISAPQETIITLLQFTFEFENEQIIVSEEVDLVLSFEEPLDEVDLFFEVETEEDIE